MPFKRIMCAAVLAATSVFQVTAESYVPAGDALVLERLPIRPLDPLRNELRALRRALAAQPNDAGRAAAYARRCLELARRESDPRYLGYAQGALAPWWKDAAPPQAILVLRATIHQANHDFTVALADLNTALRRDPRDAQARLTRAAVSQVLGDNASAQRDCQALTGRVPAVIAQGCLASALAVSGSAPRAYAVLNDLVLHAADEDAPYLSWAHGLLAEIALRNNDVTRAELHFKAALNDSSPDAYTLASYADFLLDEQRAGEVIDLLKEQTRADALLLRLAIAENALQHSAAQGHRAELAARFDAAHARGDNRHLREEARFALFLQNDAPRALRLALDNWAMQHEVADARLLLEAALAVDQPAAAQPVIAWLDAANVQDVRIAALVQRLRGASI